MLPDIPLEDFMRRDAEQQAWLKRRPCCVECGEHIQDDSAVCIRGDYYCDDCIEDMRKYIGDD